MRRALKYIKSAFTPVTLMFIPHTTGKAYSLKVPYVLIALVLIVSFLSGGLFFKVLEDASRYPGTKTKLEYYKGQFNEVKSTLISLQAADAEFRKLFSLKEKEEVLDSMTMSDMGALDMEALRRQIEKTIDNVAEIKDYLSVQRDLYKSTPIGWPVNGRITSSFGARVHPISGKQDFHTGIDISVMPGTPVLATADGIVSFSGRNAGNGNLIAIEHGFGYTTYYAHNKKNIAEVGQTLKRGDIVAYVGSTGSSTGPHLHYEVWKNGRNLNPSKFLKDGNW